MRYLIIGLNWLFLGIASVFALYHHTVIIDLLQLHPQVTTLLLGGLFSTLLFAIRRRVRSKRQGSTFFAETALIYPPANKIRYSDRMAYMLAELSELAYFEVEKTADNFIRFIQQAKQLHPDSEGYLNKLMQYYRQQLRTEHTNGEVIDSLQTLDAALANGGFKRSGPYLDKGSAQGFICQSNDDSDPFVVVVFRGSEKKVDDWLTNLDAHPHPEVMRGKVHSGFYEDFCGLKETIITTLEQIKQAYKKQGCKQDIPVFYTGHSLGGALATIATRELLADGQGACYSFGAPAVGDYDYFQQVKTPVYRVVNSSDIVPRVPSGAWIAVALKLFGLLRFLLVRFPWATDVLTTIEGWINPLKDYRHFGDLRYLTDVNSKRFEQVKLLRNPNYLDVCQWFWRHIFISFGMTVKSHSMVLYRKKLREIGLQRLNIGGEGDG